MAEELGVSARSIRFYEEKGLLKPKRSPNGYRVYDKRDRVRLKLILRGRRFGMTLDEILEVIGLAAVDMDEAEQIKKALAYAERCLDDLMQRMEELRTMHGEMSEIKGRMLSRLSELDSD